MAFFAPTYEAVNFRILNSSSACFFERIKENIMNHKGKLVSAALCLPQIASIEPTLNSKSYSGSDFYLPPYTSGEDSPLLSDNEPIKSSPSLREVANLLVDSSLLKMETKEPGKVPHHLLSSKNYTSKSFFFEDIREGLKANEIEEHLKHSFHSATNNGLTFRGSKAEIVYFRGIWAAIVKFENGRQGDFLYYNLGSRAKHTPILGENYKVHELAADMRRKTKDWFAIILRNLRLDIEKHHIIDRISSKLQLKNFTVEELLHHKHFHHALIRVNNFEEAELVCKHFRMEGGESIKANLHPYCSKRRSLESAPQIFKNPEKPLESLKPSIAIVQPISLLPSISMVDTKPISKSELYNDSPHKSHSKYSSMYSHDEPRRYRKSSRSRERRDRKRDDHRNGKSKRRSRSRDRSWRGRSRASPRER